MACSHLAAAAAALADALSEKPIAKEPQRPETARPVRKDPQPRAGLPGLEELDRFLTELIAEHRRYGHRFSLALVDVDGLRRINDAYGRRAGDLVLAGIGGVLRLELREVDRVFRVAEDEFAVVAPHTDAAGLVPMARRVANLVAGSQTETGPRIAIAAGVVDCPADGLAAERLLENATEAVYAAKASGTAVAKRSNGSGVLQDS